MAVPKLTLTVGSNPIEGKANGVFTITLDTPAPAGGLMVLFNTDGSTATFGTDFSFAAGVGVSGVFSNGLVIAEGATNASLNVVAKADAVADASETVKLNLVAGGGYQFTNNLSFVPKVDYASIATGSSGVGLEDFNNDGKLDLAVVNRPSNTVSIFFRNSVNTGFDSKVDYSIAPDYTSSNQLSFVRSTVKAGDFNGDGKLDLAISNVNSVTVSVLLRDISNTGFEPKIDIATGSGYKSGYGNGLIAVGDFNGDGKADFAAPSDAGGAFGHIVSVWSRNSDNTDFNTKLDYDTGGAGISDITTGDFNGDGKLDLAVSSINSGGVSVLLRNSTSTGFDAAIKYAEGSTYYSIKVADFNADGKSDLVVVAGYNISVLLRNATNSGFDLANKYSYSGKGFDVGDFNGDGKTDLATIASNGKLSLLLRNTTNTGFDEINDSSDLSSSYIFMSKDFDKDGKIDVAVSQNNTVSMLLNNSMPASTSTLTITDTSTPTLNTPTPITYTDTAMDDSFATITNQFIATYPATTNTISYGIDGGTDNGIGMISKVGSYGTLTLNKASGQYSFVPNDAAIESLTADTSENFAITVVSNGILADSKALAINIKQSGDTESSSHDMLKGTAGNDTIDGLAGDDTINGFAGTDIMKGGTGEDHYIVDNSNDVIFETSADVNEIDTVLSKATYTLPTNTEILVLQGTTTINGTGNASDNIITGNFGDNSLNGLTGTDIMTGRGGNDTYTVDNADDVVFERANQGTDTVNSSLNYTLPTNVENLTLSGTAHLNGTGNTLVNSLIGNSGNNILSGGNGNDTLSGGLGNDTLDGGANNDVLNGGTELDSFRLMTAGNVDTIQDFNRTEGDKIHIENAIFTKLVATGVLADALFKNISLGVQQTDDYILYNPINLTVSYDADANGAGAAVQIAVIGVSAALISSDFVVI